VARTTPISTYIVRLSSEYYYSSNKPVMSLRFFSLRLRPILSKYFESKRDRFKCNGAWTLIIPLYKYSCGIPYIFNCKSTL